MPAYETPPTFAGRFSSSSTRTTSSAFFLVKCRRIMKGRAGREAGEGERVIEIAILEVDGPSFIPGLSRDARTDHDQRTRRVSGVEFRRAAKAQSVMRRFDGDALNRNPAENCRACMNDH